MCDKNAGDDYQRHLYYRSEISDKNKTSVCVDVANNRIIRDEVKCQVNDNKEKFYI